MRDGVLVSGAWSLDVVPRAGFEPANGPVSSTANPVSDASIFSRALSKASQIGIRLSYLGNPRQLRPKPVGEISFLFPVDCAD